MARKTKNYVDYLGTFQKGYFGYSLNSEIRKEAASGGIISSVLIYLLEKGNIDGAVVTKTKVKDNVLGYETYIATSKEAVLEARGSKYFDVSLLKILNEIKEFDGKLAVVGLPCQIKALRNLMQKDPMLKKKFFLLIGLFCTHSSDKDLVLGWLKKKKISEKDIDSFFFRKGHWRGNSVIKLKDGKVLSYPYLDYGTYQILYFFVCQRCLSCGDQTSEQADISCGDVWLPDLKKEPVKYSTIMARNNKAVEIIKQMEKEKWLHLVQADADIIFKSHKRSLIFHKNVEARKKAGKLFGLNIVCNQKFKVRWNDYIAAFIVIMNYKISKNRFLKKLIFKVPKFILKGYMYFFKLLTNF